MTNCDEDADACSATGDDNGTPGRQPAANRGCVRHTPPASGAGNDRDIIIGPYPTDDDTASVGCSLSASRFSCIGRNWAPRSGRHEIVEMDENGDGIADAEIRCAGGGWRGDFVL
ncbi:MAG: hypothetical protein ACE369_14390 [Roseovarius sp.]